MADRDDKGRFIIGNTGRFNSESGADANKARWTKHREANAKAIVQAARDKGHDVDNIYEALAIGAVAMWNEAIDGKSAAMKTVNQMVDATPRAENTTIHDNRKLIIVTRSYTGLPENIQALAETKSPETAAYILAQLDPDKNEPQEITYRDEIRDWSNE